MPLVLYCRGRIPVQRGCSVEAAASRTSVAFFDSRTEPRRRTRLFVPT